MWSHPTRTSAPASGGYAVSLPPRTWQLLVQLPAQTLATILAIRCESPSPAERLAAVAAIAAGRRSDCALVREVVAAIYANDEPPDQSDRQPSAVLDDCVNAGQFLAQRVPAGEAAGYRDWVAHVCTIGLTPAPDDPIGAAQRAVLREFEHALAG
jgi:hypothetical protein